MSRYTALCLLFVFTFGFAGALHAGDDLLRNGDFSRGLSGWKGDRKIAEDGDNKYVVVRLNSKDTQKFEQDDLDVKNVRAVEVKLRFRVSDDYSGRGFILRFSYAGGSTYTNVDKGLSTEWKSIGWTFENSRGLDEITFSVEVLPGDGSIEFDDFSVTPQ
ncbi:hypothetical protein [Ruficoccus sp. ZRK36]|uniref:hypothetical protein n=1 Tax=Ruficoccus sp. ZRK36 TaxID=2866311 RepID=UPI001C73C300|nr:hypothetical protein [Ruficoccus sp. ZRK36]QYY36937.1 hypothetical protein K0V07_05530 [Ruficoccus sp. ZRK36]